MIKHEPYITVRPTAQAIGTNESNTVRTSKNCIPSRACGLTIMNNFSVYLCILQLLAGV